MEYKPLFDPFEEAEMKMKMKQLKKPKKEYIKYWDGYTFKYFPTELDEEYKQPSPLKEEEEYYAKLYHLAQAQEEFAKR